MNEILDKSFAGEAIRLPPPFSFDRHSVWSVDPASCDQDCGVGSRDFQRSDELHAGRSVARPIGNVDLVVEVVSARDVNAPEMRGAGVARELIERNWGGHCP